MPKMKTHSGAKKRFKVTASGKVKKESTNRNHIRAKKDAARKRRLGKASYVSEADSPRMKRLLIKA